MNVIIGKISLFLWAIYFLCAIYREVKRNRNTSVKNVLKKPFHFIRIDSLFFLSIYLLYNYIARDEVLLYLYSIIIITNIVYLFYDLSDNYKYDGIAKNERIYYFVGIGLIVLLIGYLLICKNIFRVASISLALNLFIPMIISIVRLVKNN